MAVESCRPKREQSYSPEDDERADLQLKVSETDTMSDDDSFEEAPPPEENEEEVTEELFEKFYRLFAFLKSHLQSSDKIDLLFDRISFRSKACLTV